MVDVNNEEAKQEEPTEQIEETKEEEQVIEVVEEVKQETNEPVEEAKEEPKKEIKPVKAQDKLVRCKKCNKEMKLKSLRYGHEQKCQGTLEEKPVKPFSKPRATPKPKAQPIIQDVEEEIREALPSGNPQLTQPVKKQILKPTNPLSDITNHYQLLQQQYIQQKQAKYQNLCQNMFSSKTKMKR